MQCPRPPRSNGRAALGPCVLALLLLTACGGGGGGGDADPTAGAPAPAPAPPTIVVTGNTSCTIAAAEGECGLTLAVTQSALTNPTYQVGSAAPVPLDPSSSSLPITLTGVSTPVVTFRNGDGTVLKTVSLESSCGEGLPWNTGKQTCSWQYDRVTTMSFSGYPAIAGADKLPVLARNDTGYTFGDFPVNQCLTSEAPQPDGVMLVKCAIAERGGLWTTLGWIIPENRLVKWEKPEPPGFEWAQNVGEAPTFVGPQWHGCQRYCDTAGTWQTPPFADDELFMLSWAPLKDGGYLFTGVDDFQIKILKYRAPDGTVTDLRDYTGTEWPPGYPFSLFGWMLTVSH